MKISSAKLGEHTRSKSKNGPPSLLKPKTKSKSRDMDLKKVTFMPNSPDKDVIKHIGYLPRPPVSSINALALSGTGHTMQQSNAKLAGEYAKRHERMQNRLSQEISKQVFVKDAVKVPIRERNDEKKDPVAELEKKLTEDIRKQNESLGIKSDLDLIPDKDKNVNTYSYIRSQRAVEMRLKDNFDHGVSEIENEKFLLIKKLNEHLLQLDQMNEEKRNLSMKLINQIKFVRQLQSNLGTSDNGHITEVIDKDLENQFKKEKHLNIQLKEKLKECEYEKERIKEQLKFLEGQKDVVVVTKTGGHMDIETSSMSINEMLRYRETILKNLEEASRDVEILRIEEINCVKMSDEIHYKIEETLKERGNLSHKIQNLQVKFDDGKSLIFRDNQDLKFELRKQKNLLAAKVIFKSINKGVQNWKKTNFQNLVLQLKYDDKQIGSILAFRKLCLKYNQKRQEKYFNLWFFRGMKPNSLLKQNREITNFQLKTLFLKSILKKWQSQTLIEQKRSSKNSQRIHNLGQVFDNLHSRQLKYAITLWRRNSNNLTFMSQKLANFCRDRLNFRIRQAFLKWNTFILHQDHTIRLKSHCLRSTSISFKTSVFQAWVRASREMKQERINTLIRVWNCFVSNKDKNKYKKKGSQAVLRNSVEMERFYQRAAYDGLKKNLMMEKYSKVNAKLRGEIDPAISQNKQFNQWKAQKMELRKRQRLMNAIINGFGRGLFSSFQKWKLETFEYKRIVKQKIILKCYRSYMKSAIYKWKNQVILKQKQTKNVLINSIEKTNISLQSNIQVTTNKIIQSIETSHSKGQRLTKKVVYNLYLRYMKARFDQWQSQLSFFKTKESALERIIITKMSRRIQKLAFRQYVQRTKEATWNLNSLRKSGDYHGFIKYNATKRMFHAFKKFVTSFIKAKKCLKRAVMNSEMRTKKDSFQIWQREHKFEVGCERVKSQNKKVAEVQNRRKIEGELQNINYEFEQKVNALQKQFQSLSHKTIAKLIARFKRYQTYTYINLWKQKVLAYNKYKHLVKFSIMQRLTCRAKHLAFQTWSKNLNVVARKKLKNIIQEEMQTQIYETEKIEKVKESRKILVETQKKKLDYLRFEQEYAFTKVRKVIDQITNIENSNFKIKRREHVFNLWKNYCYDKSRWCLRLEVLMKKNARQIAFDAIREKAWGVKKNSKMGQKIRKIIWAWENLRKILMFTKWKEAIFTNVTNKRKNMEISLFHRIKNDRFAREKKQDSVIESSYGVYQRKLLKKSIITLFDYKCKKQYDTLQQNRMLDKLEALRARWAVQKWQARAKKTTYCKFLVRNYISQNKQKLKRACFSQLKKEYVLKTFIFKKILNATDVLNKEHLRFAISQMKQLKFQRNIKKLNNRRNARDMLGAILRNWQDKTSKRYFDHFKFKTLVNLQRIDMMKSIVRKQMVTRYHSYFNHWLDQTEKLRVVQDINEHGPVRIEYNRIMQDVTNMKRLLIDEERYLPEDVTTIMKSDDKHYKDTAERVLCRLYTFSAAKSERCSLWLLHWCIDKLKQNVRDRKAYNFWMKYLEHRARPLNVQKAFDIMVIHKNSRKKGLAGNRYRYLVKIDRQNRDQLEALNVKMREDTVTVADLKGQRDFLIGKMVSSQRLAIIRCNFSLKYAKEKAFKKLRDNAFKQEENQIKYFTNDNFGSMEDLKERVKYLENSNNLLAFENDKLKRGAVNSMHLMATAEEVQKDMEILSADLSEKAIMIRKLLEDNTLLNKRLQAIELAKKMKSTTKYQELYSYKGQTFENENYLNMSQGNFGQSQNQNLEGDFGYSSNVKTYQMGNNEIYLNQTQNLEGNQVHSYKGQTQQTAENEKYQSQSHQLQGNFEFMKSDQSILNLEDQTNYATRFNKFQNNQGKMTLATRGMAETFAPRGISSEPLAPANAKKMKKQTLIY